MRFITFLYANALGSLLIEVDSSLKLNVSKETLYNNFIEHPMRGFLAVTLISNWQITNV